MAYNLNITSSDSSGNSLKLSLPDVNPAATNEQLKNFAQSVNALTTNVYENTNRVDKTPLAGASALQTPDIAITCVGLVDLEDGDSLPPTMSAATAMSADSYFYFRTDSDAAPVVLSTPDNAGAIIVVTEDDNYPRPDLEHVYIAYILVPANDPSCFGDFVFKLPETETFAAAAFTFTVTGGE